MTCRRISAVVVLCAVILAACEYVVVPPEPGGQAVSSKGWSAVPTAAGPGDDGDVRIELTIRNDTGTWSAMKASRAELTGGDGATSPCPGVFVGSGGHRLAPGMQMRGYVGGRKSEPTIEMIRVECDGAQVQPGARLAIDYSYVSGEYNYYQPDASRVTSRLEVPLDQIVADLQYPVAEPLDGVIQPPDTEITAINDVLLVLAGVERTDTGLAFSWQTSNPGEYPTYVHIGEPPVIGSDGILYGFYESPDLTSVPVTPAGERVEWTTEVAVPKEVGGLYILLSVESKKQRLFVNYALDISDV